MRIEAGWARDAGRERPLTEAPGEDEDAWIAVAARRNCLAFVTLYDRYVARIERFVAARTQSVSDVDDLVSATFERALSKIHTYCPQRGTFAAWLFTIARNLVKDNAHRQSRSSGSEMLEVTDSALGPEAAALGQERAIAVQTALLALTPDQRDALALRYAAELPFRDVARALGKSEPAAKMLVRRGLQALRAQLEENPS